MKIEKILDKRSLKKLFCQDYRYYYSKKSSTIKELENNLIHLGVATSNKPK
jgi:hypothetical protein